MRATWSQSRTVSPSFLSPVLDRLGFRDAPRSAPISLAEALPWLLPKVRPRFAFETATLRTGRPAPTFRPLAGIFAVSLVVDLPQQTLDVGAAALARWDADFDALLQRARANLAARSGEEGNKSAQNRNGKAIGFMAFG